MIYIISDLLHSFSILVLTIMAVWLVRRVGRLEARPEQRFILQDSQEVQDDPQPVCGCGHHQCFHDETGCGKNDINNYVFLNDIDRRVVPCGCKRYTGPEVLPTVIP